jgi:hypothetical protein
MVLLSAHLVGCEGVVGRGWGLGWGWGVGGGGVGGGEDGDGMVGVRVGMGMGIEPFQLDPETAWNLDYDSDRTDLAGPARRPSHVHGTYYEYTAACGRDAAKLLVPPDDILSTLIPSQSARQCIRILTDQTE